MRLLSTCICKAVLGRPDGIDLLGISYGLVSKKFPTLFRGYKIVTSWELDKTEHKTHVVLTQGKNVVRSEEKRIPARKAYITTHTMITNVPVMKIDTPSRLAVEVYLDSDMIFSFPFYFLPVPSSIERKES